MKPASTDAIRPGVRVTVRGRHWTVMGRTPYADCASIDLRGCESASHGHHKTVLVPFDRVVRSDGPAVLRVVRPRPLLHAVRQFAARAHPFGGSSTAASSAIDILPYQLEPAMAVASGATRLLIADGVGLGKTIQAGLVLAELASRGETFRAIVAAPAGLREQWQLELRRQFGLEAVVADTAWLGRMVRDLPAGISPWALPAVYIASFDFLKRPEVLRPLEDVTWEAMVVDEAHNATPGTARRAALHAIALRSRRVLLLTATPHAGDIGEYDALCRLGAPDTAAGAIEVFQRTRESVGAGPGRRSAVLAVGLHPAERHMHRLLERYTARICREAAARGDNRARLAAIVLRKRALSSAASLAASASRRLALLAGAVGAGPDQLGLPFVDEDPLGDEVRDEVLAAPGLADPGRERALLAALVERANAAAVHESKAGFLTRLLARTREPAIVFTEYRDTLARLRAALAVAGFDALVLHGGQSPAERADVQRAFNERGALLLATDAASEGLNLHLRCRLVVHFELPWNPARLEQRTGRVDRIGQRRRVHEILLVARDTAERLVLAPLAARAARARSGPGGSRLHELLTESRIAAAIMDGAALPAELPGDGPPAVPAPWTEPAAWEAARIGLLRQLRPTTEGGTPSPGVLICAPGRGRPRSHLTAIYTSELVTGDGRVEHAEIVATRMPVPTGPADRTAKTIRAWVEAWLHDRAPAVHDHIAENRRDRLATIAGLHRQATEALERRELAMAAAVPSAATRLVQAGLFDRRAVQANASRRRQSRELLEEIDARRAGLRSAVHLEPRLRLLAVVIR